MKRTVLIAAAAVVAFGSGFTGATIVSKKSPVIVATETGDACTTENGRSGYMVSSGRGWECQEVGGA